MDIMACMHLPLDAPEYVRRAFKVTVLGKRDAHAGFMLLEILETEGVRQYFCTIVTVSQSVTPFYKILTT